MGKQLLELIDYLTYALKYEVNQKKSTMAAKDKFHAVVRVALEKQQWRITDDPLRLEVGGTKFEIDLGAEQLLAAERGEEKIAVEIKTFLSDSPLTDYHAALGQFLNYRLALEISDPTRILYLAVPVGVYEVFFKREFAQISVERYQIKQIIYDPIQEVILQWIP
ncbi:fdxN element excision controlling factor protein [Anabaenopsis circularis NIES-21]|uniref:FdxN element excision controlling factor protein n=3 Tax=Nostocales TaxID=1161 RepID=A0A1Z4GFC9_9CYAN|nr:fdxN element excision controlling factor protein [Anabaenopsis circularis NIES-21]GBE92588.1 fatty-acid oxidation protein subunit alpha [Nostoc cycadae WK-1]